MRILFVSDNYPPEVNAPASRLAEHAQHWLADGADLEVITSAPNFPEGVVYEGYRNAWWQRADMDGVDVLRVKTYITPNEGFIKRTLSYMSFMASAFACGLFVRRPDVVVATSPQFFAAVGGFALAKLRRVPFVFELRDLWPASIAALGAVKYPKLLKLMEAVELFLYRHSDAIVSVTEAFKADLIERGIDGEKIHVVRNGVELAHYQPLDEKDPALATEHDLTGKFVVGYVGTHGMAHGLDKVVEAAEHLRDHPNIRILLVGAGSEKAGIDAMIAERKLDNVVSLGRFPKSDMNRIWSLCDVALIHLRNLDVFRTVIPSKLFESMGVGQPVLMGLPRGEATEIVEETGCGIVCEPESPESIAEGVLRLAEDSALYNTLREQALAAAPLHSRKAQAGAMLEIMRRCAAPGALEQSAAAPATKTREP